jgi:hypothetical protein
VKPFTLTSIFFVDSRIFGIFYIERQGSSPTHRPWFEHRNERGEHLLWLGRLHLIWTPPGWSPPAAASEEAMERAA